MAFAWHRLNRLPYRRLLLVGLLGCVCAFPVWAVERPVPKSLWQTVLPPPAADQPPTPRRPWVLRDQEIALNLSLLEILKDAGARPHPRITVEFFDGASHELDITSTISRSNDTAVIRRNGMFYIKDLGSTNGIDYKGMRIDNKRIDEGDIFHLCDYELRFTYRTDG